VPFQAVQTNSRRFMTDFRANDPDSLRIGKNHIPIIRTTFSFRPKLESRPPKIPGFAWKWVGQRARERDRDCVPLSGTSRSGQPNGRFVLIAKEPTTDFQCRAGNSA
jgi:hypothetical protein